MALQAIRTRIDTTLSRGSTRDVTVTSCHDLESGSPDRLHNKLRVSEPTSVQEGLGGSAEHTSRAAGSLVTRSSHRISVAAQITRDRPEQRGHQTKQQDELEQSRVLGGLRPGGRTDHRQDEHPSGDRGGGECVFGEGLCSLRWGDLGRCLSAPESRL